MSSNFQDVTLCILAGGQGKRLGGVPKGLLCCEGRSLVHRQIELSRPFGRAILVTNDPAPYASLGVEVVADLLPDHGAPGGVHAALASARTPWILVLGCDMPRVRPAALEALLEARDETVDVVCFQVEGRLEPLLAAYRTTLARPWGEALGEACPSLAGLIERSCPRVLPEVRLREVDPLFESVQGVNCPADMARLGVSWPPDWPAANFRVRLP